jgi:hypothetical protein
MVLCFVLADGFDFEDPLGFGAALRRWKCELLTEKLLHGKRDND